MTTQEALQRADEQLDRCAEVMARLATEPVTVTPEEISAREWEANVLDQLEQLKREVRMIQTELQSLELFTIRSRDQDN